MTTVEFFTLLIAVAGVGLGGFSLYLQWRVAQSDRPDLQLSLAAVYPIGPAVASFEGVESVLTIAAHNRGRRPIRVESLVIDLTDGRSVGMVYPYPGSIELPAALQPGDAATYWTALDGLRQDLRAQGIRLKTACAHLPGGEKIREPVPAYWAGFPDTEK